jgi:hypothetical protein
MDRGVCCRPIHEGEARTELVSVNELVQLIEAKADVKGKRVGEPPLVLHIGPDIPAEQRIEVGNREWGWRNRSGHRIDR